MMKNSDFCIFVLSLCVHNYGVIAKQYERFDEKSGHPIVHDHLDPGLVGHDLFEPDLANKILGEDVDIDTSGEDSKNPS